MNFKHLKTFVEVAHCGSFSLAATRLNTVQSAVSRHIHALEDELNVVLFQRNTRQVELSEAGSVFLKHVEAILLHYEHAKKHASNIAHGKQGVLRIGYLGSVCAYFMPDLIKRFKVENPRIDIKVFEMTASEQLDAFTNGVIDIGFSRPLSLQYGGLIHARKLLDDPILSVVSCDHELADHAVMSLKKLAQQPLILFSRRHAPSLFDTLINGFHQHQLEPQIVSEPTSMQALLTEVASGDSAALVPSCIGNLQTTGCQFIPLDEPLSIPLEMHWSCQVSAITQRWLDWFDGHDALPLSSCLSI